MPLLQAGTMAQLEVVREVDFGYFLSDGVEEVLLHLQDMKADTLPVGDSIPVFLYTDHQGRLSATMHTPALLYGEAGWLRVIDIESSLGLFLDLELRRDLLLPKSELPMNKEEWPRMGDHLFVEVTYDRQGRLIAKLADTKLLINDYTPGTKELQNQTVVATVYKQYPDGPFLISGEGYLIFLPRSEMESSVRLGQELSVRITYVRQDGRLNASTKPIKNVAIDRDAEKISEYLQSRNGAMPFSDQTEPDLIQEKFAMSKAAFKRALGKLMKEEKVVQKDGWTYLKEHLRSAKHP